MGSDPVTGSSPFLDKVLVSRFLPWAPILVFLTDMSWTGSWNKYITFVTITEK